jgi:hypothetical protein
VKFLHRTALLAYFFWKAAGGAPAAGRLITTQEANSMTDQKNQGQGQNNQNED